MVNTNCGNVADQLKNATSLIKKGNSLNAQTAQDQDALKLKKLKQQYDDQQQCVETCPTNVSIAEKNWYYARPNGQTLYNNLLQQRATKEAKDSVDDWKKEMTPKLEAITTKIDYYKSQYSYKNNVKSVYDSYNDKLTGLQNDIDETSGQKNVNNRLATFYNYNTGIVNSILYYLKMLYWLFLIIIIAVLILKRQYKDVTMWGLPLLVLIFPIFFEKGINFKIPLLNKYIVIPSIYDRVVQSYKHVKVDNIYFIFFSITIGVIWLFNYVSTFPFNYE